MASQKRCCCEGVSPFWWWMMAILGFSFIAYTMLSQKWRYIEDDLAIRTNKALQQQQFPWAKAMTNDFARDVRLSGLAPDPESKQLAIDVVSKIDGVRIVDVNGLLVRGQTDEQ